MEVHELARLNPEVVPKRTPPDRIRYIDISAVSAGGLEKSAVRSVAYADAPSRAQRVVRSGDVIVSTVRPYLRARTFIDGDLDGAVASTGFCVLRPLEGIVPRYLDAVTSTDEFYEHLAARQTGSAYPAVRPSDIAEALVSLPPTDVQRRIADIWSVMEVALAASRRAAAVAESLAVALRARLVGASIDQTVQLDEAVEVTMGRQRSPKHRAGDHLVPYLRAANVKDARLVLDDVLSMNFTPAEQTKYRLIEGDVLVTEGCGSLNQIGANAVWGGEIDGTVCFQNTLLRLRANKERTSPAFMAQWARFAFESGAFANVSSGTNIFHIGAERAARMRFPALSLDNQERVAFVLTVADQAACAARGRIDALRTTRLAVVAALLSGRRTIPDSYDRFLRDENSAGAPLEHTTV